MLYDSQNSDFEERKKDWEIVEDLVFVFKKQFEDNPSSEDIIESKKAGQAIISKFGPYIHKYVALFNTGSIAWNDPDIKSFISIFIQNYELRKALARKKTGSEYRSQIYTIFNQQIRKLYYKNDLNDIVVDIQIAILSLAKRYQNKGKNFCSYLYVSFKFEFARSIKESIKDPTLNTDNVTPYEEHPGEFEKYYYSSYTDLYHETEDGIPNNSWLTGETCSEEFAMLSTLDRQIIIKYYIEEWNDGQIADYLGIHTNTVNAKRRAAINKVAEELDFDITNIKRIRRSGISVILPNKK